MPLGFFLNYHVFFFFSSGRRETQAHYAEARLRAQMYSREMNKLENTSTSQPLNENDDLSSEDSDFDLEEDDDGFLDGDEEDDEVRVQALICIATLLYPISCT